MFKIQKISLKIPRFLAFVNNVQELLGIIGSILLPDSSWSVLIEVCVL